MVGFGISSRNALVSNNIVRYSAFTKIKYECCLLTDKILPWADCRQHCREQLTGGWQTSEVLFASQVQADRQESLPVNGGTIEKYWHRQLSTEGRRLEFSQIWNKILWKSKGKQVASIWLWELLRESWGVTGLKGRFRTKEMIVVKDVFAMDGYIHKSLMTINQFRDALLLKKR